MKLRQKKLFTIKEFTLLENGVHVKLKNLTSYLEVEIPYEEIQMKNTIRQRKTDYIIVLIGLFFALVFLINFIWKVFGESEMNWGAILIIFLCSFFCAMIAYVNTKRHFLIPTSNNGYLEIFARIPTVKLTEAFIAQIKENICTYLRKKYGEVDRDLPVEPQLTNLMWLKDRDILSEQEFEKLKTQLLGKPGTNNVIGF